MSKPANPDMAALVSAAAGLRRTKSVNLGSGYDLSYTPPYSEEEGGSVGINYAMAPRVRSTNYTLSSLVHNPNLNTSKSNT